MNRRSIFVLLASLLLASCSDAAPGGADRAGESPGVDFGAAKTVYDPCAAKGCGDMCSRCDPADPLCSEAPGSAYCDASGACLAGVPICGEPCSNDADCGYGVEWCSGGRCVACDNTGSSCDLACPDGEALYERNGCFACACAPESECIMDGECPAPPGEIPECVAGSFCWDWCPPGEPSCCYGNTCSAIRSK